MPLCRRARRRTVQFSTPGLRDRSREMEMKKTLAITALAFLVAGAAQAQVNFLGEALGGGKGLG